MAQKLAWAILGTGAIAKRFIQDFQYVQGAELIAVGARSQAKANAFAHQYSIPNAYGSINQLAHSPLVDVVYIATPHIAHKENAIALLSAGKHVLVEKPAALCPADLSEIIHCAKANDCFFMEAMKPAFFPALQHALALVAQGIIGQPKMLQADFASIHQPDPETQLFNPDQAGGALLDVGIYPAYLASALFGEAERVVALGHLGETGVDEQVGIVASYPGGALANLQCGICHDGIRDAVILGDKGKLIIHCKWWSAKAITVCIPGENDRRIEMPYQGAGFQFETQAVTEAIINQQIESECLPHRLSHQAISLIDRASRQVYSPAE